MWKTACSVLHTTYPTRSISEAERCACLMLVTCLDGVFFFSSLFSFVLLQWLTMVFFIGLFWDMKHNPESSVYFVFKIDRVLCAVPVSKFLPQSICSVQLGMASVKNKLGTYSLRTRAESHFWNTSEMCCGASGGFTSIVSNVYIQLQQPCCKWTELSSDTRLSN